MKQKKKTSDINKNLGAAGKTITFLRPTKWSLVVLAVLYASNYITFFGLIINYPIFYFYWNYSLTPMQETVLAVARFAYLYALSIIIVKLLAK